MLLRRHFAHDIWLLRKSHRTDCFASEMINRASVDIADMTLMRLFLDHQRRGVEGLQEYAKIGAFSVSAPCNEGNTLIRRHVR